MKKTYCDCCQKDASQGITIIPMNIDLCGLECLYKYFIPYHGKEKLISWINNYSKKDKVDS